MLGCQIIENIRENKRKYRSVDYNQRNVIVKTNYEFKLSQTWATYVQEYNVFILLKYEVSLKNDFLVIEQYYTTILERS